MSFLKRLNTVALLGLVVVVAILALLAVLPNAFAQSKAVLKSYPCPADRIEAVAEQIRAVFKDAAEVRVAVDRRNGQILVHAPAEVQDQIAAHMNPNGVPSAAAAQAPAVVAIPAAAPPAPAADASALTAINVPLRNITARQFEAKLCDILKNRLAALPSLMPGTDRYQFASARQDGVEFSIDLSTNQVMLRGPAQSVMGAGQLVRAMDSVAKTSGENVRLIAYQAAKPENMKKAVDAIRLAETGRGNGVPMVARLFAGRPEDPEPKPNEQTAADEKPAAAPEKPRRGARKANRKRIRRKKAKAPV